MREMQLTRQQRRQMQKLADRVDKVTQADRGFFERFPHRAHRVRLASQAEIEQNAIIAGDMSVPPWQQHFMAVRNITPGIRLRLSVVGPRDAETDLTEDQARAIYEQVNNDEAKVIEAQMRRLAEARA